MNQLAAGLFVLALPAAAAAQNDRIVWADGTATKGCQVTDFTWREVKFSEGGRNQARPADDVVRLEVEKVNEAYKRALAATSNDDRYNGLRAEAEKLAGTQPFLAQFGFLWAARLLLKNDQHDEAFALLEKMEKDLPNAGFRPEVYRIKLDYYLSGGKESSANAKAVARKYSDVVLKEGWPDGFVHEATYYDIRARAAAEEIAPAAEQTELKALLAKVSGTQPAVADRVRVQLAGSLRRMNRLDEARKMYEEVAGKESADDATRGQALLGLGHTLYAQGDSTQTEPYRAAMLAFLRVYLETAGAAEEVKAEALYYAAEACDKWRGQDAPAMSRRLRSFLRRDFPASPWTKR